MHVECRAKLNRAGFFGDVMVRVCEGRISISGMRVRGSFVLGRLVIQRGLGVTGLVALQFGVVWGLYLIVFAFVFAF